MFEGVRVEAKGHPKNTKVFAGEHDISRYISRVEIVIDCRTGECSAVLTCPFPSARIEGELKRIITEEGVLIDKTTCGATAREFEYLRRDDAERS
jgi:hypothetical protein